MTVARDAAGLVNITATDPHDLFLAQGYVHAQERMWQMEVWRHISAGRLSELFGAGSLDTDRFIRTLGWRRAAERDLAAASPAITSVLGAYAEGVNAWLEANRGDLGLAFLVAGADPEPWTPLDTLTWGKVQAWNLGGNMDTEIFRYLADARLGDPSRTDELLAARPFGPVIAPTEGTEPTDEPIGALPAPAATADDSTSAQSTAARSTTAPRLSADAIDAWLAVAGQGGAAMRLAGLDASGGGLANDGGIGSNSWVVRPELSASGGALLANDPHLGISMPSIWFINGLHCATVGEACPYDVSGVSFPGVPGVVLGHNARIAWGATNADPDVQDLVIETVDPNDPSKYLGPDGTSLPFTTRTEEILVSGAEPVQLQVRETIHGPILNDVDPRLEGAPLMALRWTGIHPDAAPDRTFEAVLGLDTAASWDEFRASLSLYGAPSQNFVYADVDGRVGYQLPGYVPIRSDPNDRGDRPVSGSDGTGEWVGRIPYADLPSRTDPSDGWIVTANNAIVDDGYPAFIAQEWDPGYRAERISDLINAYADDGITLDEMGRIQSDSSPLRARDAVQLARGRRARDTGRTDDRPADLRLGRHLRRRQPGMRRLSRPGNTTSSGRSSTTTLASTLRATTSGARSRGPPWRPSSRIPASAWWDDTSTPGVEVADQVILAAMDAAGADLRAAYGDPAGWSWGRLHTATFEEQTIGANSGIGPLEWYFNEGPVAVPGRSRRAECAVLPVQGRLPGPDRPVVRPGRYRRAVLGDQPAVVSPAHRPVRS